VEKSTVNFDIEFASLDERERQYDARNSVASFECAGILDVQYGPGKAESLDIYPAPDSRQPAPVFVFIYGWILAFASQGRRGFDVRGVRSAVA
jgi:hypothetical protein